MHMFKKSKSSSSNSSVSNVMCTMRACLFLMIAYTTSALSCLNPSGEFVSAYVVHNTPRAHEPSTIEWKVEGVEMSRDKMSWGYFEIGTDQTNFSLQPAFGRKRVIGDANGLDALGNTKDQWKNAGYKIAWNDQVDDSNDVYNSAFGNQGDAHDKGFLMWNDEGQGVYLGHSYPKWTPAKRIPTTKERKNGQHAICISLPNIGEVDKVLRLLSVIRPKVLKPKPSFCGVVGISAAATNLCKRLGIVDNRDQVLPWLDEYNAEQLTVPLRGDVQLKFEMYGKPQGLNTKQPKVPDTQLDIYTYVAQQGGDPGGLVPEGLYLKVSTWERYSGSQEVLNERVTDLFYSCPHGVEDGFRTQYVIQNAEPNTPKHDHSKWGYSADPKTPWVVFSGSNRRDTQHKRGALLIAIEDNNLYSAISFMYEGCDGDVIVIATTRGLPESEATAVIVGPKGGVTTNFKKVKEDETGELKTDRDQVAVLLTSAYTGARVASWTSLRLDGVPINNSKEVATSVSNQRDGAKLQFQTKFDRRGQIILVQAELTIDAEDAEDAEEIRNFEIEVTFSDIRRTGRSRAPPGCNDTCRGRSRSRDRDRSGPPSRSASPGRRRRPNQVRGKKSREK